VKPVEEVEDQARKMKKKIKVSMDFGFWIADFGLL
jgi:hypothetical protein